MKKKTIQKLEKLITENNRWNAKVEHIASICEYEKKKYGSSVFEKFVKENTPIKEYKLLK
jgi:hypothetical protein